MASGFVETLKANRERFEKNGVDVADLEEIARDMEANGYDANPEQWEALNASLAELPEKDAPEGADSENVAAFDAPEKAENARFVSGDKPGTGSNPIGYPGTDQDQEGPGMKAKTVPGQKPLKKPGE